MKLEMTWTRNEQGLIANWNPRPEPQDPAQADDVRADTIAPAVAAPWLPKFRRAKQVAVAA